jgi:hypothetical protein
MDDDAGNRPSVAPPQARNRRAKTPHQKMAMASDSKRFSHRARPAESRTFLVTWIERSVRLTSTCRATAFTLSRATLGACGALRYQATGGLFSALLTVTRSTLI